MALIVLAAALVLTAPASAKDQWVVAFGEEPFTLDPAGKGALAAVSDYVQIHIFDALVDFTGPNLQLRPMLATRWENPNPTTWRFHLRRDVTFHNGDRFTAEDVKFTIETQLANKGATVNAYLGPTEGARVLDPYTVEITTRTPFPALLFNLSRIHILPRAYGKMGTDAFAAKPVGSGPYRFVEWQRGQRIVLDADPEALIDHAARPDVAYGHKASMLQDVEARRATEIDYLNGGIARFGRELGVPTPLHDAVTALIKGVEASWR